MTPAWLPEVVNLSSTISAEGEAFLPDFRAVLRGGPFSSGEAAPWTRFVGRGMMGHAP